MVEGCWYNEEESISMEEKIVIILNEMSEYLSIEKIKKLQEVILKTRHSIWIVDKKNC